MEIVGNCLRTIWPLPSACENRKEGGGKDRQEESKFQTVLGDCSNSLPEVADSLHCPCPLHPSRVGAGHSPPESRLAVTSRTWYKCCASSGPAWGC